MSPKGKYFLIKNKSTGLYLDVQGYSTTPGSAVYLWSKTEAENQQWYLDPITRTIRSRQSNLCLDLNGSKIIINSYQNEKDEQHWVFNKDQKALEIGFNAERALDIDGDVKGDGTEVSAKDREGKDSQKWKIENCPIRYFYIRSELGSKVLEIAGSDDDPGAKVIYKQKNDSEDNSQLWFEDFYGNIRSKLNPKLVLDGSSGMLQTGVYHHDNNRTFWARSGTKIINVHNHEESLDVTRGCTDCGTEICVYPYHGQANQQWHFDHTS